ncbi:sugar phosphate isomerase/epimerase family protein [Microbacterium sp. K27]|uniref:sugar phosphate isomerase/epimerase family protein n=1 Tax=Microbacterium sp. K27 TaxID=2305445 RepID=UPI00109B7150|nr:TIM barrel protein [Microbacterium sp. K27]
MTRSPLVLMNDWVSAMPPRALVETALREGYDGVELWLPSESSARRELVAVIDETGAPVSLLVGSVESDPEAHRRALALQLDAIGAEGIAPLHITLHAGRDHWRERDLDALAGWIVAERERTGMDILVETHRARMLPSAHSSARLLERHPGLRLTLDVSHWMVSAESLLQDQPEAMALAVDRADHIHARFGHAQSPQIDDPRSPRWASAVEAQWGWWDLVVDRLRSEGRRPTFLAEFGPSDYATPDPRTGLPLGDPAALNRWITGQIRARYASGE